jgi:hypothetical protein
MTLSAEHLLSVVRRYWPAELAAYLQPATSPERKRLQERWRQELTRMEPWRQFIDALGGELPGFTIGNVTVPFDACFRCAAYPKHDDPAPRFEWVVVGCVSILAPVYTVYGVQYARKGKERLNSKVFFDLSSSELGHVSDIIGRRIEAVLGFSALPREMADTHVPLFVDPQQPPNTTLFHALFTGQPESVP